MRLEISLVPDTNIRTSDAPPIVALQPAAESSALWSIDAWGAVKTNSGCRWHIEAVGLTAELAVGQSQLNPIGLKQEKGDAAAGEVADDSARKRLGGLIQARGPGPKYTKTAQIGNKSGKSQKASKSKSETILVSSFKPSTSVFPSSSPSPSYQPSDAPSSSPSDEPSDAPSSSPSVEPSNTPSSSPSTSAPTQCSSSDPKCILEALYDATNGAAWDANDGWGVSDPCTGNGGNPWFGINCVGGDVTGIGLCEFDFSVMKALFY